MVLTEQLLFGFISSLIGWLGGYIYFIEKRNRKDKKEAEERRERERRELLEMHAKERKELLDLHKQQFDQLNEIAEETNKVGREHINILSGLKTLLENNRRNVR